MPHDIVNGHIGHNDEHGEHLHSHMPDADKAEELQVLTEQFIEGFVAAKDKMSYLRIAGVPLEIGAGGLTREAEAAPPTRIHALPEALHAAP